MILVIFFILYFALIGSFLFIIFEFIKHSEGVNPYNRNFGIFGLSTVFILLSLILIIVIINIDTQVNGLWMVILLCLPLLFMGLLILISNKLSIVIKRRYKAKVLCFSNLEKKLLEKINGMKDTKKDMLRKINHVLFFFGLFILWFICLSIVVNFSGSSEGMIVEDNNMLLLFIRLFSNIDTTNALFALGWFYYVLIFFFYLVFIIMFSNEMTRKSKNGILPFNTLSRLLLSDDEKKGYGSYLYFSIGHLFAALFCPPMVLLAILGMSSIGDLMASQIGMRYGKNHIQWNQKKTWEGAIAATITCFIICFFFLGIIWGVIFSLAYLLFDIFTGKGFRNIDLSDNYLIPIGCTIIYLLIRAFFNLNYYTIFLG